MKMLESKLGAWIVAAYLLLVLLVSSPLLVDAAIHHGNAIAYLVLVILTLPYKLGLAPVIRFGNGRKCFLYNRHPLLFCYKRIIRLRFHQCRRDL